MWTLEDIIQLSARPGNKNSRPYQTLVIIPLLKKSIDTLKEINIYITSSE